MTKENFLLWARIQGIDLERERVCIGPKSRDPKHWGAEPLKNGQWHLYDNSGTYIEFRGSERKVFSRMQEILSARLRSRVPKPSTASVTVRELAEWAERYGLMDMPIRIEGRPYPSHVTIQGIKVADSASKNITYLSI